MAFMNIQPTGAVSLPFTVSITNVTPAELPAYLDPFHQKPPNGQWMDFPISPVMIDGDLWIIYKNGYADPVIRYKGTNIETGVRQPDGKLNPTHPTYGTVIHPYILGRMWYDAAEKKLYAPMHCEYPGTSGDGNVLRQTHLATSTDKGLTWSYEGPLLTGDMSVRPFATSGSHWDGGDGDFYLYADERGGYHYIFTTFYMWPKPGVDSPFFMRHRVARCKISDKMAPGRWQRFYNGAWSEPGIGGKSSYVDAHCVIYSTYLKKYVSFNYGTGLSVCSDLAKQDWSPCLIISPGGLWGTQRVLEMSPMDAGKTNTWVCDRTLYLYTYFSGWNAGPGAVYRLEFGPGATPDTGGYLGWGVGLDAKKFWDPDWEGRPSMDPLRPYGAPSYDNPDPIESRRTRQVNCLSAEMQYTGTWRQQEIPIKARVSETAKDRLRFDFAGGGIYWRAAQGPDCGKADILLDGTFQKTVDCCGIYSPYKFWFVKTGLDPAVRHNITIVVRGEKNANSTGTAIKHLSFEYAAESTRASDGFSGVMGKNDWHYQFRDGDGYHALDFDPKKNCWRKGDQVTVGPVFLIPGEGKVAVRQWVAPHDGIVRVEGTVSLAAGERDGVEAQICHNIATVWSTRLAEHGKTGMHDIQFVVAKGDAISFGVSKHSSLGADCRATWDPVVTFVRNPVGQPSLRVDSK